MNWFKLAQNIPNSEEWINSLIKDLGKTDNPEEAGFILADGTMVNLSRSKLDKNWKDHRIVSKYLSDEQINSWVKSTGGDDKLISDRVLREFINTTGAVRFNGPMPVAKRKGIYSLDLTHPLTDQQIKTIININPTSMYLFNSLGGNWVDDIEYLVSYLRKGRVY